ncbi:MULTISPECIES: DNA-directed RNA polymerase subunit omega [unclassified Microcoleus]|uniref:DNA-directed RNA polymerase subunit omega n=1 Tax=unclassified Microcoleus TaxID=2642155 RepID=UPI002FD03B6D
MSYKRPQFDSFKVIQRAEDLVESSNRYRITVQIAKRAKRYRLDDLEYDNPMAKPVIRAIMEMPDELRYPEIIGEVALLIYGMKR